MKFLVSASQAEDGLFFMKEGCNSLPCLRQERLSSEEWAELFRS